VQTLIKDCAKDARKESRARDAEEVKSKKGSEGKRRRGKLRVINLQCWQRS